MAPIVSSTTSTTSTIAYIRSDTTVNTWRSIDDLIDERIQETVSAIKSTLSAMACTGCSGNIDPQTLVCTCCGRQYRLVAKDDKIEDRV